MKVEKKSSIVWFRNDLRVADNPALSAAIALGVPVLCVYIWAPGEEGDWPPGAASRWWVHHSLLSLDAELRRRGSRLTILRGSSKQILTQLAAEINATTVFWNKRYEPASLQRDREVAAALESKGVHATPLASALLFNPDEVKNSEGKPYKVFTQFWRRCLSGAAPADPLKAPATIPPYTRRLQSLTVEDLKLLPAIRWTETMEKTWSPGCQTATAQLKSFLKNALRDYARSRDIPSEPATSRLSPHLHFGEISARQVWHVTKEFEMRAAGAARGEESFLRELCWRDFAYYLLYHFPHTPLEPLRPEFKAFPWRKRANLLKAWQRGGTGYPLVDAGMRELWATGWMHNRVRMIVASFLIKDLLIDWQTGARWFWDTLVDADLANNTLGWQWVAGCGADAAPFFRIFNPVTQGEKFDPDAKYIRKWVPELSRLSNEHIQTPWLAPKDVLDKAGVKLAENYPRPIVDHAAARDLALDAFAKIRRARTAT
jgi:deoxyribodipyrimidine photo-lyase